MQGLVHQLLFDALTLADLVAQFAHRGSQLASAVLHSPIQFGLRLLARHRCLDVLCHIAQQRAVFIGVMHRLVVALHNYRPTHLAINHHRHAQKILCR